MGYDAVRFVNPVDEEFLCSICLGVFENPVHGRCGHTYCRTCIIDWITNHENTCPLDRISLYPEELVEAPLPLKNLINRLLIKCEYECEGCTHVCMISSYNIHHYNCMFNPKSPMFCDKCRLHKASLSGSKFQLETKTSNSNGKKPFFLLRLFGKKNIQNV